MLPHSFPSHKIQRARATDCPLLQLPLLHSLISIYFEAINPDISKIQTNPSSFLYSRTMATFHRSGSHERLASDRGKPATPLSATGDHTLGPEEEKLLRLVAEDDPVADEIFCQKAIERLVLAGKLEEALQFADATLPNGATSSPFIPMVLVLFKLKWFFC